MPYIIEKQQVDFEGFPVGRPGDKVGPFDTKEEASTWLNEHPKYKYAYASRSEISIVDPFRHISSPDDNRWA